MDRIELVGGPHCGATINVPPGRPINVWVPGAPKQRGNMYRLDYAHAPSRSSDVAYRWDRENNRYVYAGPYEDVV